MSKNNNVRVIDLFAGPGGLGEGFSSVISGNGKAFKIKLSIEKDKNAHETLELRSFYRQFYQGKVPAEYYEVLRETNIELRKTLKEKLFEKFSKEYNKANKETWQAELGSEKFPEDIVDQKISAGINGDKNWVLIGGPPCQAYSLVGRSRVGGIDQKDHRVYLYKEYLRIIAKHHPAIFVMENVKGLLSAKVNNEKVFDWMLRDLSSPSQVFPELNSPNYKVYSLSTDFQDVNYDGNPSYKSNSDYVIKSEEFGIPQKRHRIILLGIREDINVTPSILKKSDREVILKEIISDLPKIRSGINRTFQSVEIANGKKKRSYKNLTDSDKAWEELVNKFNEEINSWNGFSNINNDNLIKAPRFGTGSEFLKCKTPSVKNPLYFWYFDSKLKGIPNHVSRSHLTEDLKRYMFSSIYSKKYNRFPRLTEFSKHSDELLPDHKNVNSGKFTDRFRVQLPNEPATTITSHISKDGHYFIHYDSEQCRSLTVREAARIQTFPDNYLFCGPRTAQYHQVGNAVPPYLAYQIANVVKNILDEAISRK